MSAGPLKLVVVGNQVQLQPCSLYAHHTAVLEQHHVCPESWWIAAGKPVASPMKGVCPNCHSSTHVAIDGLLAKRDVSLLPSRCRALAKQAFEIAAANGLTPAKTL